MTTIAVAKGDGIGPEIMDAVLHIFNAAKVPLEYQVIEMGKWVFDKGFSNGTVSYTHLDVYKRQALMPLVLMLLNY